MEITDRLISTLKRDEGVRKRPYEDSEGYLTVGVGHNLEASPLSPEIMDRLNAGGELTIFEVERTLVYDIITANKDAECFVKPDAWSALSQVRKEVLINMAFNLGLPRLSKFRKLQLALNSLPPDYEEAAAQMLDSLWARQVGARAQRLADAMRTDDPDCFDV